MLKEVSGSQQTRAISNENGEFCFDVKPSEYTLTPIVSEEEKTAGLRLSPASKTVKIESETKKDVAFRMMKLNVAGTVKCLDTKDCTGKKVSLEALNSNFKKSFTLTKSGAFSFEKILPGTYKLEFSEDSFCWSEQAPASQTLAVEDEDLTNLKMTQVGFSIKYAVTSDLKVQIGIEGENRKPQTATFSADDREFCFTKRASRVVIKPVSCMTFDQETFVYDFTAPKRLHFTPTHYLVKGQIKFSSATQHSQTKIQALAGDETVTLELVSAGADNLFTFEHNLAPDTSFTVTPLPTEDDSSLLFYPKSQDLKVTSKCLLNTSDLSFEARNGLVFAGRTEPAIEDVAVIVKIKGTDEVVISEISQNGSYKLAPLYDTDEYDLILEKEGYQFDEATPGVWNARILSYLSISITDEEGKPVPGVLLSISSGKKFRQFVNSDEAGKVSFVDLYSGKYYLTLLLKEYSFSPNKLSVEINDGMRVIKEVKATKVAFSVYGNLNFVSGKPIADATVVATSTTTDHSEETTSEEDGSYRIRGLNPDEKYEVTLGSSDASKHIQRAVPET